MINYLHTTIGLFFHIADQAFFHSPWGLFLWPLLLILAGTYLYAEWFRRSPIDPTWDPETDNHFGEDPFDEEDYR